MRDPSNDGDDNAQQTLWRLCTDRKLAVTRMDTAAACVVGLNRSWYRSAGRIGPIVADR